MSIQSASNAGAAIDAILAASTALDPIGRVPEASVADHRPAAPGRESPADPAAAPSQARAVP